MPPRWGELAGDLRSICHFGGGGRFSRGPFMRTTENSYPLHFRVVFRKKMWGSALNGLLSVAGWCGCRFGPVGQAVSIVRFRCGQQASAVFDCVGGIGRRALCYVSRLVDQ